MIHGLIYQSSRAVSLEAIKVFRTKAPVENNSKQFIHCRYIGPVNDEQKFALQLVVELLNKELTTYLIRKETISLKIKWDSLQANEICGVSAQMALALAITKALIDEHLIYGVVKEAKNKLSISACTGIFDQFGNVHAVDNIVDKVAAVIKVDDGNPIHIYIPYAQISRVTECLDKQLAKPNIKLFGVNNLAELLNEAFNIRSFRNDVRAWRNKPSIRKISKMTAIFAGVISLYSIYQLTSTLQNEIFAYQVKNALTANDIEFLSSIVNCGGASCNVDSKIPERLAQQVSEVLPKRLKENADQEPFANYRFPNNISLLVRNNIAYLAEENKFRPLLDLHLSFSDRVVPGSMCAVPSSGKTYRTIRFLVQGGMIVEVRLGPNGIIEINNNQRIDQLQTSDNPLSSVWLSSAKSSDCRTWLVSMISSVDEKALLIATLKDDTNGFVVPDPEYRNFIDTVIYAELNISTLRWETFSTKRIRIIGDRFICLTTLPGKSLIKSVKLSELEKVDSCQHALMHDLATLPLEYDEILSIEKITDNTYSLYLRSEQGVDMYPHLNAGGHNSDL